MKESIILQADVDHLGLAGEKVEVARGYARNYLFPKGFAVPQSEANERRLAATMATVAERKMKLEEKARARAAQLEEIELVMPVKVGEGGRLFGSVTTMDLAKALAEQDWEIDRKKIDLKDPVKTMGYYQASVKMEVGVVAALRFKVVDETNPDGPMPDELIAVEENQAPDQEEAVEAAPEEAEAEAADETAAEEDQAEEQEGDDKEE